MSKAVGRNAPCPCGSGKKFKHCCALKSPKASFGSRIAFSLILLLLLSGAIFFLTSLDEWRASPTGGPGRVWSEEHQHWH